MLNDPALLDLSGETKEQRYSEHFFQGKQQYFHKSYNEDVVIGSVVMVIIQGIFEVCGKLNGSQRFF